MGNLIRGEQNYLFNSISAADFGMYFEGQVATGNKHLVVKKAGIDINGGDSVKVSILNASAGQKKVITAAISWLWNGESSKVFTIEVVKQPLWTGFTNDVFPVVHQYSYLMPSFVTNTVGTLHNTDKIAIVNGLIAAIAADVQLGANQVNTGACVVGTLVNTTELRLTAIDFDVDFTMTIFDSEWTQTQTTAFKRALLTYADICRIFSVKPEDAGTIVTQPLANTEYVKIQIRVVSQHYGNVSASVYDFAEQVYNLYMPLASLTTNYFEACALPVAGVVPSMSDTASAVVTLQSYLNAIADTTSSIAVTGISTSAATVAISGTASSNWAATLTFAPTNATNKAIIYTTSDATHATVDALGVITGVAAGTAVITATTVDGGFTATTTVTVS